MSNGNGNGIDVVSILYIFIFLLCFFFPFAYYLRLLWNDRKRAFPGVGNRRGGSAGSATSGAGAGSGSGPGSGAGGIVWDNRNLYGLAASNSLILQNIDPSLFDPNGAENPEMSASRIKYLQEKQGQIRQLLAPYTMVLKDQHFQSRPTCQSLQSGTKNDRLDWDDAHTTLDEEAIKIVEQKPDSATCSDENNNDDTCSDDETDATSTNESISEYQDESDAVIQRSATKRLCFNNDENRNVGGANRTFLSSKKQVPIVSKAPYSDTDRIDVSENPYGDEESIMIRAPIPGLTYVKCEEHYGFSEIRKSNNNDGPPAEIETVASSSSPPSDKEIRHTNRRMVSVLVGVTKGREVVLRPGVEEHLSQIEEGNIKHLESTKAEATVVDTQYESDGGSDASTRLVSGLCTICLSTFRVGAEVTWSSNCKCEHVFHNGCIEPWLLKQTEGPLCPCCRRDFITDPLELFFLNHDSNDNNNTNTSSTFHQDGQLTDHTIDIVTANTINSTNITTSDSNNNNNDSDITTAEAANQHQNHEEEAHSDNGDAVLTSESLLSNNTGSSTIPSGHAFVSSSNSYDASIESDIPSLAVIESSSSNSTGGSTTTVAFGTDDDGNAVNHREAETRNPLETF